MKYKIPTLELMLIATWFIGVMAVKFSLPLLPTIAEQFHTSQTLVKYTISIFLFGKAAGMFVFGPLSEKYGRKRFMLIGLGLFSCGNLLSFAAPNIEILLLSRLLQGLGTSATVLIGRTMINDNYKANKAAVVFSYVFLAASIIISFLPMLGSLIATHFIWRVTFLIMAAYSAIILVLCALFLEDTHRPDAALPVHTSKVLGYYRTILSHPLFLGYVLCSVFMIAGESAFNTASSFLLMKTFGVSTTMFGGLITLLDVGHLVGTLICGKLVKKYNLAHMMGIGVTILFISTFVMAMAVAMGFASVTMLIVPMIIFYVGTGFVMTITAVGAVTPFPRMIAISSAASLFINFSFSALSSALMGLLSTKTAGPVSTLIAFCGFFAFCSWYCLICPKRETQAAVAQQAASQNII